MSGRIARLLTIQGQVQGVFLRAETQARAARHGVVGWVANRPDGTVQAWLEGPSDAVRAVEDWVRAGGSPAATVTQVDVAEVEPADLDRFEVRSG